MPFREVMYSYFLSLYQYVRTAWPVSIIYGPSHVAPSEETREKIGRLIALIKGSEEKSAELFSVLKSLPRGEDWLSVTDPDTGYDVLQHAVLYRRKDMIVYLVTHGCDPARYHCSPPVHLAAYLGEVNVLQMLMDFGAKTSEKRGICYPESHVPIAYEARYFSFSEYPVYLCKTHRMTPIQCAIHKDNLSCAQAILKREGVGTRRDLNPHSLLMYACREGAPQCIQYFVDNYPEGINSYLDGDTPLLAAVPWGEECVSILLESGADVHLRSEGIQETALHRLYRQNMDGLFTIYDTTKYLLTTGIEQEVNAYTDLGETPLHMLISHVSYTGGNYVDPQRRTPRAQLQDSYQKQVLAGIRLLLEFNADPHLLNSPGLTSLSRMLHIGLKAVHPGDKCECVESSQPNMFIQDYRHDYHNLAVAMETLLQFGSRPNFTCQVGHSPLILLLQLLLYDDLANICPQHRHVVHALQVLLQNGADPNFTDGGQGTAFSLVAFICRRCFVSSSQTGNSAGVFDTRHNPPASLREQFAGVMNDVLAVLLQYGLEPNHVTSKSSQHLRGGQGNGLIEFVKLAGHASSSMEFEVMEKWIRTLLQWGADPDLEPYPSEPIICHCQSSIFLKKLGTQPLSHYIHEVKDKESLLSNVSVQRVLLLFYHSMSHAALHSCLSATRSMVHLRPLGLAPLNDARLHALTPTTSVSSLCDGSLDFLSMINAMSESPRSLKEIARVSIYKSMDRQLAGRVEELPIPHIVKRYLMEVSS